MAQDTLHSLVAECSHVEVDIVLYCVRTNSNNFIEHCGNLTAFL